MINEIDVTLTDYALAFLSIFLASILYRIKTSNREIKVYSSMLFVSLAFASFFGGTAHGFFPDKNLFSYLLVWKLSLVFIGLSALFLWGIVGNIDFPRYKKKIFYLALVEFIAYIVVIVFVNSSFVVAIINYLIPVIFLLVSFIKLHLNEKNKNLLLGIFGISFTLIAALVQILKIPLHPIYFGYNAFYHLIQAVGLVLIFIALRHVLFEE